MQRNIFIVLLFIGTACAMHLEYLKVDSDDELLNETLDSLTEELVVDGIIPDKCFVCKWAVNKIKKHLGNEDKAAQIKEKLRKVCDGARLLKSLCKRVIGKFIETLTEELSTSDDAQTICAAIRLCKSAQPSEFTQTFPEVQQQI